MTDVKKILEECEAILTGHFLLTSGKHSDGYVQCAKLLMYPERAEQVLKVVADKIKDFNLDAVVGPAIGGVIVSYELARQLGAVSLFTERENEVMTLRRGFTIKPGARVMVTEDVITTGKSSFETIDALKDYGVEVLGLATIVNRSGHESINGYKIYSAIDLNITNYEADDCPLCKDGIELVKPGSRKKFYHY